MASTVPSASYSDNDFDLDTITITSNQGGQAIDFTNLYSNIFIYESVFTHSMIGEIWIEDGINLAETLPIVGNESIELTYRTKGVKDSITLKGKVVAPIGKARTENDKVEMYKLQFVSEIQFADPLHSVSVAKSGTIAGIAQSIFKEHFGDANLSKLRFNDDTVGIHKFIFPYWSPLFILKWLAERAFVREPSCFMFYEDVDGFHFKNLMKAIQAQPVITYLVEPPNQYNQTDVNSFLTRVIEYSITSFFNRLDEYSSGMYSGTLHTHDMTKKKLTSYPFDYKDMFDSTVHLNKHPLFPKGNTKFTSNKLGCRSVLPIQTDKFKGIKDNEKPETYFMNRSSIEKQFTTLRVTCSVPGNSTLRLLDVVALDIPKIGYLDLKESDWKDPYLSGNYIVVAMKTVLNKLAGYTTVIELAKDSLIKGIPDQIS